MELIFADTISPFAETILLFVLLNLVLLNMAKIDYLYVGGVADGGY
jgi:hypothetical protein